MGTPEESIVPSVRVKRATAILRMSEPTMGSLRTKASHWDLPDVVPTQNRQATNRATGIPKIRYQ